MLSRAGGLRLPTACANITLGVHESRPQEPVAIARCRPLRRAVTPTRERKAKQQVHEYDRQNDRHDHGHNHVFHRSIMRSRSPLPTLRRRDAVVAKRASMPPAIRARRTVGSGNLTTMATGLTLELCSRDGGEVVSSPNWDDVERMIHRLDGRTHCEVFIGDRATTEGLYVTGGPRRFVSWIQRWDVAAGDLEIDTAYDPSAPPGTVRFSLSNGQVDEVPATQTVDLKAVMQAARTYLESKDLDPEIPWIHEGPSAGPDLDPGSSPATTP
jgi:hypothetical protein